MNKLAEACNISVGTLYMYYKDKEDLFQRLGVEYSKAYYDSMLLDFSLDMSFTDGLWKQWENRIQFALEYPKKVAFHHMLQVSQYSEYVMTGTQKPLTELFTQFIQNCISKNEIKPVSYEVFWCIAYCPLYTLIGFHSRGRGYDEKPYHLNEKDMKACFETVVEALSLKPILNK